MNKFILKKRPYYVQMTCRIEESLLEKAKETVLNYNLPSVNAFINDCLRFAFDNMEIEETDKI